MEVKHDSISEMGSILIDKDQPVHKRVRALFELANTGDKSALTWIEKTLLNDESVYLRHECGYVMGQMMIPEAVPTLISLLNNTTDDPIVRHECGEALGNIYRKCKRPIKEEILETLVSHQNDPSLLVAQTLELAIEKIERLKYHIIPSTPGMRKVLCNPKYPTQDPASPVAINSHEQLRCILNNNHISLFEQYQALFSLRNIDDKRSVDILGEKMLALRENRTMDLMLHEIGYIFGQISDPDSVKYLKSIIECKDCHEIARHECVIALGSIANGEAVEFLEQFRDDPSLIVKQSVLVALDMAESE